MIALHLTFTHSNIPMADVDTLINIEKLILFIFYHMTGNLMTFVYTFFQIDV